MDNENDLLRRKIKIVAVKLAEPGKLGSLVLEGGWQAAISARKAEQLKPYEGTELEIGEIIRLGLSD